MRRGWGSVALLSLTGENIDEKWKPISDIDDYRSRLSKLIGPLSNDAGGEFNVSAFAGNSRIWIGDKKCGKKPTDIEKISDSSPSATWSNPVDALDWLGRAFLNYRARGRPEGTFGNQAVQAQFVDDYDWFRKTSSGVDVPYRTAFGLPHMYNSRNGEGVNADGDHDRRASPVLFHIHNIGDISFCVLTYFPTKFLDGNLTAVCNNASSKTRAYPFGVKYGTGTKPASGDDIIRDFVGHGHGPGTFTPNQLLTFTEIKP